MLISGQSDMPVPSWWAQMSVREILLMIEAVTESTRITNSTGFCGQISSRLPKQTALA